MILGYFILGIDWAMILGFFILGIDWAIKAIGPENRTQWFFGSILAILILMKS